MKSDVTHNQPLSNKGALLGEFAQFAIPASEMTEEQKKRVEARFGENDPSGDVQEMLKHRDLQMRAIGERLRFERQNGYDRR